MNLAAGNGIGGKFAGLEKRAAQSHLSRRMASISGVMQTRAC